MQSCSDFQSIARREERVLIAVIRTVIGQMLSRKAAQKIFGRIELLMKDDPELAQVTVEDLLAAGASRSKAKTILNFAKCYAADRTRYDNWAKLSYEELQVEVCQMWGMSTWSASILAIFYFAHENVFPDQDGMIKKALKLLEARKIQIDPERCAPYKTYLAIFLWKLVDEDLINKK